MKDAWWKQIVLCSSGPQSKNILDTDSKRKDNFMQYVKKISFTVITPKFFLDVERPHSWSVMNGIQSRLSLGFSLFTSKTNEHIFNICFDWQTQGIDANCKSNLVSKEKSCQAGETFNSVTAL